MIDFSGKSTRTLFTCSYSRLSYNQAPAQDFFPGEGKFLYSLPFLENFTLFTKTSGIYNGTIRNFVHLSIKKNKFSKTFLFWTF